MKVNAFLTAVSALISTLAGYGFYAGNSDEPFCLLLAIGSGLCLAVSLAGTLGIKVENEVGNVHFRIVSAIFFILFLICNLVFAVVGVRVAPYIIICGILLLAWSIIEYGIVKSKM